MFPRAFRSVASRSIRPTLPRPHPRPSIYHQLPNRLPQQPFRNASHLPRPPRGSQMTPEEWHIYRLQNARPLVPHKTLGSVLRSKGTKITVVLFFTSGAIFYVCNLEDVPQTGRKRFNCVSEESAERDGRMVYQQIMHENGGAILPEWDWRVQQVRRVMNRLIPACGLEHVNWEVNVINSPEKNAFVIPGGKVFVYTGILPICGSDDGLAAVLGHEIAHTVAKHSAERMSSAIMITPILWGMYAVSAYFDGGFTANVLGRMALDLGITRPASRKQESEADYIGLLIMAQACYNPDAAVALWQRMQQAETDEIPEWTSTHPSNANRIERIRGWLPEAREKRDESGCGTTANYVFDFNKVIQSAGFW